MPTDPPQVTLCEAHGLDLNCIENMMQFYNYDLSQWYPIEFDVGGLYKIRSKAEYWANPRTLPYLIRVNDSLAGFAVVDHENVHPESAFNLGYFFVARRYRGQGIATAAFSALLPRFPGLWEVYHLGLNEAAARFWPTAFERVGVSEVAVSNEVIHNDASVLYRFTVDSETKPLIERTAAKSSAVR